MYIRNTNIQDIFYNVYTKNNKKRIYNPLFKTYIHPTCIYKLSKSPIGVYTKQFVYTTTILSDKQLYRIYIRLVYTFNGFNEKILYCIYTYSLYIHGDVNMKNSCYVYTLA